MSIPTNRARLTHFGPAARHRLTAVVACAVLATALVGCAGAPIAPTSALPSAPATASSSLRAVETLPPYKGGRWRATAESPLSPRTRSLMAWTGKEVLVIGGDIRVPCQVAAKCVSGVNAAYRKAAKEGAAYNPATDSWRRIAPAPIQVNDFASRAMVGGSLVIADSVKWYAYDPVTDKWSEFPTPPSRLTTTGPLGVVNGTLYTMQLTLTPTSLGPGIKSLPEFPEVYAFDVATRTWLTLPLTTLSEMNTGVPTPAGFVGFSRLRHENGAVPYVVAEVFDGSTWKRLPRSPMVGGYSWQWTGERLISIDRDIARAYAAVAKEGGALEVRTGTWSEGPPSPPTIAPKARWDLDASAGSRLIHGGFVYDDSCQAWTPLIRPKGAPTLGMSAVWAHGDLMVFGGFDETLGFRDKRGMLNTLWIQR